MPEERRDTCSRATDFQLNVTELRSDLAKHMEIEEIVQKNQLDLLQAIKDDIKVSRDMIHGNRSYFDDRITQHHNDFQILLKENYMTRAEITAMREMTVNHHVENRHDEIKEAKVDAIKICVDKDKAIYHQLNQLKNLLYGGLLFITTVTIAVVSYFKNTGQP